MSEIFELITFSAKLPSEMYGFPTREVMQRRVVTISASSKFGETSFSDTCGFMPRIAAGVIH